MPTKKPVSPKELASATAAIVAAMPLEQAAQVYDFARFLRAQPAPPVTGNEGVDDWLNDSEEDLLAEDAVWEAVYEQNRNTFLALRESAQAEIERGETEDMFGDDGDVVL